MKFKDSPAGQVLPIAASLLLGVAIGVVASATGSRESSLPDGVTVWSEGTGVESKTIKQIIKDGEVYRKHGGTWFLLPTNNGTPEEICTFAAWSIDQRDLDEILRGYEAQKHFGIRKSTTKKLFNARRGALRARSKVENNAVDTE